MTRDILHNPRWPLGNDSKSAEAQRFARVRPVSVPKTHLRKWKSEGQNVTDGSDLHLDGMRPVLLLAIDLGRLEVHQTAWLWLKSVVLFRDLPDLLHELQRLIVLLHLDETVRDQGQNPSTSLVVWLKDVLRHLIRLHEELQRVLEAAELEVAPWVIIDWLYLNCLTSRGAPGCRCGSLARFRSHWRVCRFSSGRWSGGLWPAHYTWRPGRLRYSQMMNGGSEGEGYPRLKCALIR